MRNTRWVDFRVWCFQGRFYQFFAKKFLDNKLFGFDSFEGLAEDWLGYHMPKGTFNLSGKMPEVAENVKLIKGWFNDTLPGFLAENNDKIRFAHIDCDTFEAASYVLDSIAERLTRGTVLVFDEYIGYPNWRNGEFRAWKTACNSHGVKYEYIAFSNMQVAVKIL